MIKKILLIVSICIFYNNVIHDAIGACVQVSCTSSPPTQSPVAGCENGGEWLCFQNPDGTSSKVAMIPFCRTCQTGYNRVPLSNVGVFFQDINCSPPFEIMTCQSNCTGCTNCNSTDWANTMNGVQAKVTSTCNCNTCNSTPAFRCQTGYYGTPTNATSGCARCPKMGDTYGTTTGPGKTSITDCQFPANITLTDETGTYKFTSPCAYTK